MEEGRASLMSLVGLDRGAEGRIGRFLVVRPIGRSGDVVEAYDETLGRGVVVKLLPVAAVGGAAAALEHARALSRLSHPSVARVFEAGVHEQRIYLVMERVQGVPLADWLAAAPPLAVVLATLVEVGRAVGALHAASLLHGDLRHENVRVSTGEHAIIVGLGVGDAAGSSAKVDRARFGSLVRLTLTHPELPASAAVRLGPLLDAVEGGEVTTLDPLLRALAELAPVSTELTSVARSQQGLALALALSGVAVGATAWLRPAEDFTRERMLVQPLLGVAALTVAIVAFRTTLRAQESRRVLGLVWFGWVWVMAHRVFSFEAGVDTPTALVAEAVGLALLTVAGALRHRAWMAWCGAPPVAYAIFFTLHPARAAQSFPLMLGLFLCVAAWLWRGEQAATPSRPSAGSDRTGGS